MGAYVQAGVCIRVSVARSELAAKGIAKDDAVRRIGRKLVDLSMFVEEEDNDLIRWELPRELIEQGLVPFLRAQYALFGERAPEDPEAVLGRISAAGGYEGILALAKGRSLFELQASTIGQYLYFGLPGDGLRVKADLLVYLVEGKVMMEEYLRFFGYVEALIHAQKAQFPIAAVVKVFID